MATSQSGKRKLIPHAQKDGLFRVESERESRVKWGKRQARNTEGRREQIEPDAVKGTVFSLSSSLSLSVSPSFPPFLIPDVVRPTIYKLRRETIESVFHGIISIEGPLKRLRRRLIGYEDAL